MTPSIHLGAWTGRVEGQPRGRGDCSRAPAGVHGLPPSGDATVRAPRGRFGVVSMCIETGMGDAAVLEAFDPRGYAPRASL